MSPLAALATMALAAFGAATLLPFQSEVVFAAFQTQGTAPLVPLIIVASVFNTLGSAVNYALGRGIEHYRHRRWFPVSEAQLTRAQEWYSRWGIWTLLLSWAPLGDAITVIAGIMRTPLWLFLTLVGLAKTLRYILLAALTAQLFGTASLLAGV
ncbi:YqaA family protein [Pseudooceanicola sp. 502str34]|uniref:YqaA family protein n=1 Tax=Maritimibacter alkaliphilus TaxID=404236 RepID=UPI001C97038D|nr:YqaA family protein [Maritimibacter alkaliphilus]MBY6090944.1 DedA family protein [Maritimibacter alkaliphilus]